ncbi:MAG: hypothetical protein ABFD82_03760 [Syntrophaceae bacterium]
MPIIDYNGQKLEIPYDPRILAHLIYRGYRVFPDDGLSEEQQGIHNNQIGNYLRKLWGNKQFNQQQQRSNINPFEGEQARINPYASNYMGVQANPFIDYSVQQYDSNNILGRALGLMTNKKEI